MLDPMEALRAGLVWMIYDWKAEERFVEPSFIAHGFLREAARDPDVINSFRESMRLLIFDEQDELLARSYPIGGLAPKEEDERTLREPALAILLGLAVIAAMNPIIGLAGRDARKRAIDAEMPERELINRATEPPPRPAPDEPNLTKE